jgi:hypothetical protein
MKPKGATSKTNADFIPRCAWIVLRLFDDACRIAGGVNDDDAAQGHPVFMTIGAARSCDRYARRKAVFILAFKI